MKTTGGWICYPFIFQTASGASANIEPRDLTLFCYDALNTFLLSYLPLKLLQNNHIHIAENDVGLTANCVKI